MLRDMEGLGTERLAGDVYLRAFQIDDVIFLLFVILPIAQFY